MNLYKCSCCIATRPPIRSPEEVGRSPFNWEKPPVIRPPPTYPEIPRSGRNVLESEIIILFVQLDVPQAHGVVSLGTVSLSRHAVMGIMTAGMELMNWIVLPFNNHRVTHTTFKEKLSLQNTFF